ncbi:hypothetical protein F5X71_23250 [Nocardia brasiliensis]|uniref:Uncharacterized protein n=1 Tax=Nocardia brasiliensis TaxID=37326 RepID=A0A6G9XVD7_NOCBR|nr:hypothetical protein [Nocardia brasiliensis]QIS04858.1 hypothetical protein F5X71_23250 [Nocardia brasiliensis]
MEYVVLGIIVVALIAVVLLIRRRTTARAAVDDPMTRARTAGSALSGDYRRGRHNRRIRKKDPRWWALGSVGTDISGGCSGGDGGSCGGGGGGCGGGGGGGGGE